jgi:hypothetical protein
MNKYEQLIEHIINDDEAKARALFHQIVVEKSRDIYESLMDEEYAEEDIHAGNPVDRMMDEIQADESGMAEDEDMDMMGDEEPISGDDDISANLLKSAMNRTEIAGAVIEDDDRRCHD